jgi:hypothetical protein
MRGELQMSTIIARSHVRQWETSDFSWTVPAIVLLLLLIGTIGVISGFPTQNIIGPDGFLGVP